METFLGILAAVITIGVVGFLVGATVANIRSERRRSTDLQRVWKNFSLSLVLLGLFVVSWLGHASIQWNKYADEQRAHGEPVTTAGYLVEFGESTLENWQSEFLQLFSFVVLAAMFVHHGSAESKDGDERMEALLEKIAKKVGA
jgi:hypothetical protein